MYPKLADEDLHIFIIDAKNLKNSIKLLESIMKSRTRVNREHWLIDIGALGSIENGELMLQSLQMDIDDDIYLYMFENPEKAHIWEIYKRDPTQEMIVFKMGTWSMQKGLNMSHLEKWHRRGNLNVKHKICITFFALKHKNIFKEKHA